MRFSKKNKIGKLIKVKRFIDEHPLARRHKMSAYYRFLSWQIKQFFSPAEKVVPFVGTTKLIAKKGMAGATGNIYTGLHEFSDMGFLLHFLREDDLFFDIGANIGSYTILASGCAHARSIAFEPVPSTFQWLKRNIDINKLHKNIEAFNWGIGRYNGTLHFTKNYDTINHVIYENGNHEEFVAVQVKSIDGIVQKKGFPILVKIDVEGYETEVINGMQSALISEDLKAIIIELNGSGARFGFADSTIHETLLARQFLPYSYNPFERKLELLRSFGTHNTIYIKDIDFASERVKNSNTIKVFSEEF